MGEAQPPRTPPVDGIPLIFVLTVTTRGRTLKANAQYAVPADRGFAWRCYDDWSVGGGANDVISSLFVSTVTGASTIPVVVSTADGGCGWRPPPVWARTRGLAVHRITWRQLRGAGPGCRGLVVLGSR